MVSIIIYVSGGNVQDVITDREDVQVMIVDYDNEQESGQRDRSFQAVKCSQAYFDRTVAALE